MSHYKDAETMMLLADQRALAALETADAAGNPMAALPMVAASILHLLAAQVHATLAVADAMSNKEAS